MAGEARLADLCESIVDCPHSTPVWTDSGVVVLRNQNIRNGRLDLTEPSYTDEAHFAERTRRALPTEGDLVITREAPMGEVCMIPPNLRCCLGQRMVLLRPNRKRAEPRYLLYALQSKAVQHEIGVNEGTGSTVSNLRIPLLESLPIPTRPLPEQRAIAHILGTLDDKIEVNRRMNETLEAMARALFKSWFVDFDPVRAKAEGRDPGLPQPLAELFPNSFEDSELGEIPRGWEVGPLGRFFSVGLGGAWGEDEASDRATVRVRCLRGIDCHELAEGRIPDVPVRWVTPKQAADRQLSDGNVLIEGSGSFCGRSLIWKGAYAQLLGEPIGYSNFCKRLDPVCSSSQAVICWMQMRQAYRDGLLQSFRTGTAFPNFDVHGTLGNLIVVVPPVPLADAYGRMFEVSQRLVLMAQSRTLAALRDSLLPKLISGELQVEDAQRFVGDIPVESSEVNS
ncbi:hypothetical protein BURK1_00223 [Burkholderiales bacterium]|nr:hypothetical protein BURK1_00223 [Burkholderiales bacterium]